MAGGASRSAVATAVGCAAPAAPNFTDRLHLCSAEEGPTDAYCGGYDVFEDRDKRSGKTIRLNIVVLPSIGADVQPDPLVFLAGGPGQGAAQMAGADSVGVPVGAAHAATSCWWTSGAPASPTR